MQRFNRLLFVSLLVGSLAYWWLLLDTRPGDARPKPVSIEQLRGLAASKPGPLPAAIEMEQVSFKRRPGNIMVAGSGLKRRLLGVMAFRLLVPGGKPVIIDTGMRAEVAIQWKAEAFDERSARRVENAMSGAGLILATHEHPDHMGGLAALAATPVLANSMLNRHQLPSAHRINGLPWASRPEIAASITPGDPQAVAPGIVVIPAPSHTPGSQLIFVRLQGGQEFLFAGDVATMAQNWQELRARSRLQSEFLGNEDRGEVFAWLLTIRKLKKEAPGLVVIPGHDRVWLRDNAAKTGIRDKFSSPTSPNKPLSLAQTVR